MDYEYYYRHCPIGNMQATDSCALYGLVFNSTQSNLSLTPFEIYINVSRNQLIQVANGFEVKPKLEKFQEEFLRYLSIEDFCSEFEDNSHLLLKLDSRYKNPIFSDFLRRGSLLSLDENYLNL